MKSFSSLIASLRLLAPRAVLLRRVLCLLGGAVGVLCGVVLLAVVALYCPPVQRWAVGQAAALLSERTGLRVEVQELRLTPLLNLRLGGVVATDSLRDTLLNTRSLALDVAFWPLFEQRLDVEAIRLRHAQINSKSLISDVRLLGAVDDFSAQAKGIAWRREQLRLNKAVLRGAQLQVWLSDTATEKPDTAPTRWCIEAEAVRLEDCALHLSLPGDTLHLSTRLREVALRGGHFDLGQKAYRVQQLQLWAALATMNQSPCPLPSDALFEGTELRLRCDSLGYNAAQELRIARFALSGRERLHGLPQFGVSSRVELDRTRVGLTGLHVQLGSSSLRGQLDLPFSALEAQPRGALSFSAQSEIALADVLTALRSFLSPRDFQQVARTLSPLRLPASASVQTELVGNLRHLALRRAQLALPDLGSLSVEGWLRQLRMPQRSGSLRYALSTQSLRQLESLLPPSARQQVRLPHALRLTGGLDFAAEDYRTHFRLSHEHGAIQGQAAFNLPHESYEAALDLQRFPLAHFLPHQPLTPFTGRIGVKGRGFSLPSLRSGMVASARIDQLSYAHYPLSGLSLTARLEGEALKSELQLHNALAQAQATLTASLSKTYAATLSGSVAQIDLRALGWSADTLTAGGNFSTQLTTDASLRHLHAQADLSALRLLGRTRAISLQPIALQLQATPDTTTAQLAAGDLGLRFAAAGAWQQLAHSATRLTGLLKQQLAQRHIDQHALKHALPTASLHLEARGNNPLASLLRFRHYQLSSLALHLDANRQAGLNGHAHLGRLRSGQLLIDTLFGRIAHTDEGLTFDATVRNERRTNPQPFTATLRAYVFDKGLGAQLAFMDREGD